MTYLWTIFVFVEKYSANHTHLRSALSGSKIVCPTQSSRWRLCNEKPYVS